MDGSLALSIGNKMLTKDFKKDFDIITTMTEPFSFTRYADGEHAVMVGKDIVGYDWRMTENNVKATKEINDGVEILRTVNPERNFIGVSCPCCDEPKHTFFKVKFADFFAANRITYSNLFVNSNYDSAEKWFKDMIIKRPIFLINGKKKEDSTFNFIFKNSILFPSNILEANISSLEDQALTQARKSKRTYFLVALGPYSEIIIPKMVKENYENFYIDVGSLVDPYIHGKTRDYHSDNSQFRSRVCSGV